MSATKKREWGGLEPDTRRETESNAQESVYGGPHPRLGPNLQKRAGGGDEEYSLVTCPLCGHEFGVNESRSQHIHEVHRPEDAGLTPIQRRPTQSRLTDTQDPEVSTP